MKKKYSFIFFILLVFLIAYSCADEKNAKVNIIEDPNHQAQVELRETLETIRRDIMDANIEGLQSMHLDSEKFTKFGPRSFDRQDVNSTNLTEANFFSSVSDMNYEIKDLKIDVFGDVGIVTYYPYASFVKDSIEKKIDGRQTFVFLKTANGWKLIHEHGTIRTPADKK